MSSTDKKVSKKELEAYLAEARSWETHRVLENERSKRLAWRVAGAACLVAAISVTGISVMGPLKKVEPYVIRVDNTTGIVDVVTALKDQKTNYDEVMNKFFVQRYVRYRESYSHALASDNYTNVGLMSGSAEQQRYYAYFNPKNPESPLNVYQTYATVKITIKSTSFIKPDVALVRYIKEVERGGDKSISNWAATVTFTYTKASSKEKDREVNPLGFRVEEYRNDPEGESYEVPAPVAAPVAERPAVSIFPQQSATQEAEQVQ
ncbi:type IV secretion system protein VirB8 [Pseudomonas sp. NFPP33]|nr:virB8 family protein [Pseudomonas sp. NFPP33]AGH89256.1 VirB8-like conjugal transfer protein [uncultured bacterium]SDA85423.1 type IV secretion system protein VirB8 [Pseudomonas sp. NFPP33]